MKTMSIVVPCYNEEKVLPLFYFEIVKTFENFNDVNYELIFVDDGSKDATLSICKEFALEDDRVHYLSFTRNFGKEAALLAGLEYATGDLISVMDADLQDPPYLLKEMISGIDEGYDCVATRRVNRKGEPPIRSFFARVFYKLINGISKTEIVDGARDYRLMTRQMVDAIISLKEYNRFSKGIFGWVGFNTKWLEYQNIERAAGETKWSFWKLLIYSIEGIVAFSTMPLAISSIVGIIVCLFALVWMMVIIVKTLLFGDPVTGFPTLACLLLWIGGSIHLSLGILGQYLAKTYLESKNRPPYLLKENNFL